MVYDPMNRRCPVHPTIVHPCSICGTPGTDAAHTAANTPVDQVNWEQESQTPYNTPAPQRDRQPWKFQTQLAADLGLDEHLDDPQRLKNQAPPQLPTAGVPWKAP
jgi:hypothetical protein